MTKISIITFGVSWKGVGVSTDVGIRLGISADNDHGVSKNQWARGLSIKYDHY